MWVDLHSPSPAALAIAAETIRKGGIVLHPTDTVYGLGCDPFNPRVLERLYAIKGRPEGKGVLLLIPERSWIPRLASKTPDWIDLLGSRFWPGPLTVILEAQTTLPGLLTGSEETVGIRIPDSLFLQGWMKAIPGPVVSTSANLSGEPSPSSVAGLRSLFGEEVDLFLDAGDLPQAPPSTVIDLSHAARHILRQGEIGDQVKHFLATVTG